MQTAPSVVENSIEKPSDEGGLVAQWVEAKPIAIVAGLSCRDHLPPRDPTKHMVKVRKKGGSLRSKGFIPSGMACSINVKKV